AAGPRRCTVVVPPTRAKPIPGLTEASELKSVGLSHSAAQTRTRGPAAPLTTRILRPTHASEAGAVTQSQEIWRAASPLQVPPEARRARMARPVSRTSYGTPHVGGSACSLVSRKTR